jgi:hypothetical protein
VAPAQSRRGCLGPVNRVAAAITSPVALYQQLFVEDTAEGRAESLRRLQRDRSLLDGMRDQFKALQQRVGANDRERLDQFATAIRDLESSLAASESWVNRPKPKTTTAPPKDIADVNDFKANARAMLDLVRLALETDSTRVITLSLSTFAIVPHVPGVQEETHGLTHHGNDPGKIAQLEKLERAQVEAFAGFLTTLRGAAEAGGTLLDRTQVLYGSCLGNANSHSNENLPILLAGGGYRHPGHLAFDEKRNEPLANLFVTMLQRLGVEADAFASSTGSLRGLDA